MPYGFDDFAKFGERGFGRSERRLLGELANQPDRTLDFSFQTPEYLAAQERTTLAPIRSMYGSARRQAYGMSLRTGSPVSAAQTRLVGQEGGALDIASARNFLTNTRLAQAMAQQRFQQGQARFQNYFNLANAAESRYRANKASKGSFLGSLGRLAGLGLSFAFPPAAPFVAGANMALSGTRRISSPSGSDSYGDEGFQIR